jgi:hypothetical protein
MAPALHAAPALRCSRFCLLTSTSSPVPPSQTLGVLFFPLSPPSRKGATHNQRVTSSSARLPGLSYHSKRCAEASQLLLENQSVSFFSIAIQSPKKIPFLFLSPLPLSPQTLIPSFLGFPPFTLFFLLSSLFLFSLIRLCISFFFFFFFSFFQKSKGMSPPHYFFKSLFII